MVGTVMAMGCATTTIRARQILTIAVSMGATVTTMAGATTSTSAQGTPLTAVTPEAIRIMMERVTPTTSAQLRLDRSRVGVGRVAEMGRATVTRIEAFASRTAGRRMTAFVIALMELVPKIVVTLRAIVARVVVMA
jgi:hypothetical protein